MSSRTPSDDQLVSDAEVLPRALLDAWREHPFEPGRIQRAYARYRHGAVTPLRQRPWPVWRWVALGGAIGMSSVYAATESLRALGFEAQPVTSAASPTATPSAAAKLPAPGVPEPVKSEQEPAAAVAFPPASEPVLPPAAVASSEQWKRVARSLRERDYAAAEDALEELARHGSAAERESSLLVRAQLLLSQGKHSEASSLLRALHASTESVAVRRKATELLERASSLPSQRSFEPPAGTNSP